MNTIRFKLVNNESILDTYDTEASDRKITFIVLQTCQVLSFIAYLVVGFYFLSSLKDLKKSLNFHPVIIILFGNFLQLCYDISLILQYLYTGTIRPSTYANCIIWIFIDSLSYYSGFFYMAWAAFERHLLIFHSHVFNTNGKRFFCHYLPMIIIGVYSIVYYVVVDFFYPCVNEFDYSHPFCGLVCYMNLPTPSLYSIELIAHQVVPVGLIIVFSLTLVMRVILAHRRLRQSTQWRKYRKLITQLVTISIVYLIFGIPYAISPVAQTIGLPAPFSNDFYTKVIAYWSYGICYILPFMVSISLPNLIQKVKPLFKMRCSQRVAASI